MQRLEGSLQLYLCRASPTHDEEAAAKAVAINYDSGAPTIKGEKDWTRRIGNDRHLICIEDPSMVSHDLGRVVDKFSIKVLREEFKRAADVMQYDPNP
ncbi:hypothetical protein GOBAR_DD18027 [Gossypium barbadense]|nr:hypothetical protein GOBAR_DD18027 [Gossypium barbadense]